MHKTSDKRLDTLLERARECAKRWPHWRYAIAWPKDVARRRFSGNILPGVENVL